MKITDWNGCYDDSWKGLITDESFAHPAKFSRGLIFRIVEYLLKSEMVKPGDTVIDPFGGVALGGLPCLLNGLNWIGNELEEKFVELGRKNIELWNSKFAGMPKWTGQAVLLRGDSRKLASVIQQAGGLVSSPPYAPNTVHDGSGIDRSKSARKNGHAGDGAGAYGTTPGQLASLPEGRPAIVSSPPYASGLGKVATYRDPAKIEAEIERTLVKKKAAGSYYGITPGQLGNLKGDSFQAVVSSPPFAGNSGGRGEASRNGIDPALFDRHQGAMVGGIGSEGNLAGMKPGPHSLRSPAQGDVALVTSPPFADSLQSQDVEFEDRRQAARGRNINGAGHRGSLATYGQTEGQLGAMKDEGESETFWSAARLILEQCHQLLPPGAPAVFVLKSFVRDGAIVDFPGQWQALCESCGFETVEVIRAWLVKDKGTQVDLNGNGIKQRIERKSFFRRTGEQNTRAKKHWQILGRDDQAGLLRVSHTALWADYWSRFNTDKPAPKPNRSRILRNAQAGAYARDGKPHYEIETAIDFEVVLVTRKRAEANDANL